MRLLWGVFCSPRAVVWFDALFDLATGVERFDIRGNIGNVQGSMRNFCSRLGSDEVPFDVASIIIEKVCRPCLGVSFLNVMYATACRCDDLFGDISH